jgi:hypothetical protein
MVLPVFTVTDQTGAERFRTRYQFLNPWVSLATLVSPCLIKSESRSGHLKNCFPAWSVLSCSHISTIATWSYLQVDRSYHGDMIQRFNLQSVESCLPPWDLELLTVRSKIYCVWWERNELLWVWNELNPWGVFISGWWRNLFFLEIFSNFFTSNNKKWLVLNSNGKRGPITSSHLATGH